MLQLVLITATVWTANFSIVYANGEGASTNDIIERFENIPKAPYDRRSYRGLKLSNHMKILLISDPLTDRSAAAMSVGVGSLNDFRDVPGIANLVACMLTAGSKQYSKLLYGFEKFILARGGQQRLSSGAENQVYSFDVNPNRLADALKRFADFFIKPFLSYSSYKVLEAVLKVAIEVQEREYRENKKNDQFRIAEVEKIISKKNHAFNHFFNGNEERLYQHAKDIPEINLKGLPEPKKASLSNKARQFYSIWYSSNIMCLVVLGKESLDELENMVVPLFRNIENKNVKQIVYPYAHHPWGPNQVKNRIFIVPLSDDAQFLRLTFACPDVRGYRKTAPELYVGQLLAYEGPGGLIPLLRKRGLCDQLEVDSDLTAGFGFYTIVCSLTDDGIERVDEAINLILQFIYFLKDEGVQERIFWEIVKIQKLVIHHHLPEKEHEPISSVMSLALDLLNVPTEDILLHAYTQDQWDPSIIQNFFCYLRADNMNVSIVSKKVEKVANLEEPNYGTRYFIEPISEKVIEKWQKIECIPEFQIPPENKFIPENFDTHSAEEDEPEDPYIIHESSISEIWFKQDCELGKSALLQVDLAIFSKPTRFGPSERASWHLFELLFVPFMKEYFYPATVAGFEVEVLMSDYELLVKLCGLHDTLPVVLERLLSELTKFDVDEETFNAAQKRYVDAFSEGITENHYFQLNWHREHLQIQGSWSVQNNLNAGKMLQFQDWKKFLTKIFRRVSIRGLIHGNYTKQKAMCIVGIIEKSFHSSRGMLLQEVLLPRRVEMSDGSHLIYQTLNEKDTIYGYAANFQFNAESTIYHTVASKLLFDIIEGYYYKILLNSIGDPNATIECTLMDTVYGIQGLSLLLVTKKDTRLMDMKVEKFLHDIPFMLSDMSLDLFESMKEDLEMREYAKPTHLSESAKRYWHEIKNRYYNFRRANINLEQLRALKITDLLVFFEEMLSASSSQRRKLAVYVFPRSAKQRKLAAINYCPAKATKFTDLNLFQTNLNLLPVNS